MNLKYLCYIIRYFRTLQVWTILAWEDICITVSLKQILDCSNKDLQLYTFFLFPLCQLDTNNTKCENQSKLYIIHKFFMYHLQTWIFFLGKPHRVMCHIKEHGASCKTHFLFFQYDILWHNVWCHSDTIHFFKNHTLHEYIWKSQVFTAFKSKRFLTILLQLYG